MGDERYKKTQARYMADMDFVATITHNPTLTQQINDADSLSKHPEGSLGRLMHEFVHGGEVDYAKFLSQYDSAGLNVNGAGVLQVYNTRERELHDIIHVLFGYERTRFGEAATISTQYWQGGPSGFAVISFAGVLRYLFIRPKYGLLVLRALWSAWRRQVDVDLRGYDFEKSLHKPVETVKTELGIKPPSKALQTVLANTRWED